MTWLLFIFLALVIGVSGYYLCRSADAIGEALGISQNWVGAVLLATITSTPELISGITAVSSSLNLPELAVGNALGGNVFNLMLVFALDLLYRKRSIYSEANLGHVLTAALGIMMMAFVLFFFILQTNGFLPAYWDTGLSSFMLPLIYLLCMKTIYQFEVKSKIVSQSLDSPERVTPKLVLTFAASSLAVILGGLALPHIGQRIISEHGWNQAFVGTVFMAAVTSCPEMAVSLAALRLRLVNMALSNLLASNIFNLLIIAVDDFFYREGPLFLMVSERNILTLFSGILMTALVIVGLVYNPTKKILNTVNVISLLIFAMYIINNITLFKLRN